MGKKIAIWGTGESGKILFYKLREKNNIICWYSDEACGDELYNVKIKKYNGKKEDETIVIAEDDWKAVCTKLAADGLQIIDDYIPYWIYNEKMIGWKSLLSLDNSSIQRCLSYLKLNRKIAIIYGNCQTEVIQRFLSESDEFAKKYVIVNIPRVCQETEEIWEKIIESGIFSFCDLLVYQIVSTENKYGEIRSTSYIEELLNENCVKVSIPNIYFDGYFPQLEKNKCNVLQDVQEDGLFKWGDKFVNQLLTDGMNTDDIIRKIFSEEYLSDEVIQKSVRESFENLQKREAGTDIKICDYIRNHFKERQLFFAPNHPNNELLLECSIRILKFLGMDTAIKGDAINLSVTLMGEDVVVYPSVIKKLGLKNYYKCFYPNRYIENLTYSAAGYYRLYCEITSRELMDCN